MVRLLLCQITNFCSFCSLLESSSIILFFSGNLGSECVNGKSLDICGNKHANVAAAAQCTYDQLAAYVVEVQQGAVAARQVNASTNA
jgi:hypothetical protein